MDLRVYEKVVNIKLNRLEHVVIGQVSTNIGIRVETGVGATGDQVDELVSSRESDLNESLSIGNSD
jgi:hypothetical protein